jgi:hypothetical protein
MYYYGNKLGGEIWMEFYFKDNFFSAGITPIEDAAGHLLGTIDLQSAFTASLTVYGPDSAIRYMGRFPFFSHKWEISDGAGTIVGRLRSRFTLFSKRYEYEAKGRGLFSIISPAFSYSYSILDANEKEIASFEKTSRFLQAGAFALTNHSQALDSYELIAVVMGVQSIQKAMNSGGGAGAT